MSDLIWNGCECAHCTKYFSIFDAYLMSHQYYDGLVGYTRDVTTPMLFGPSGYALSQRLLKNHDLDALLKYPLFDRYWDFHTSSFVDISELNGDDSKLCKYNESCFKPICTCLSHFLIEYVHPIADFVGSELKTVCLSGVLFCKVVDYQSGKISWKCIYE
ncbi:unnamed protein product [Ambrosiozyma monospora]|uniref:Unnamed protein product n=1 Tax=Ambrosiozyma monospora TaxID=43982 RepID=A0ACB5UB85_AMBMO|nr:unnamed protein product [Ambrosiozyma monospora]